MNREETEMHWKKIFCGKHVDGKRIVDVWAIGPPSFFSGIIIFILEDGSEFHVMDPYRYKPRISVAKKFVDEFKEGSVV